MMKLNEMTFILIFDYFLYIFVYFLLSLGCSSKDTSIYSAQYFLLRHLLNICIRRKERRRKKGKTRRKKENRREGRNLRKGKEGRERECTESDHIVTVLNIIFANESHRTSFSTFQGSRDH
jgi:hypothetical protein